MFTYPCFQLLEQLKRRVIFWTLKQSRAWRQTVVTAPGWVGRRRVPALPSLVLDHTHHSESLTAALPVTPLSPHTVRTRTSHAQSDCVHLPLAAWHRSHQPRCLGQTCHFRLQGHGTVRRAPRPGLCSDGRLPCAFLRGQSQRPWGQRGSSAPRLGRPTGCTASQHTPHTPGCRADLTEYVSRLG